MNEIENKKIKRQANFARPIFLLLLVITVIIFTAVLKVTGTVFIPVTVAILLSLIFEPLIDAMRRKFRIPWVLGIIIVFSIVIIAVLILATLLIKSLGEIIDIFPKYEERFTIIYTSLAEIFGLPFDADNTLFENLWSQVGIQQALQASALSLSGNLLSFLKNLILVALFAIFFLLDLRFLRAKLDIMMGDANKGRATRMFANIIEQITRYISVKFYISLATGFLVFIGTLAIGLDFPIIWAFIAFILNFIPNFGSIISGFITSLFALLQFWPNPGPIIFTVILMIAVNFVLGNFIEPRIQGRQLGLSPFVIIVALSFWGWLWGFTGLVLGVPMMVILKIVCENFSILHPVSVLMGNYTTEKARSENVECEETEITPKQ